MLPVLLPIVFAAATSVAATPATDTDATETLLRAAAYDRNLEARTPQGFRLGVAFDPKAPSSKSLAESFKTATNALKSSGSELAPEWIELVAVDNARQLYRWMKEQHVSAIYVPENMGTRISSIVDAAEAAGVFTIAGSPEDVEGGLVVGVRVSGGSKKLVINMAAAERCGVDFDAAVRQVAERVGEAPHGDEGKPLRDVLERYQSALEKRSLAALRVVWPALGGEDEKRVVASFEMSRSHRVDFALLRVDRGEDRANARVRRVDRLVTKDGQKINAGTIVDISFSKSGNGSWQIESMSNATPPS